jgi:hypothetical protein
VNGKSREDEVVNLAGLLEEHGRRTAFLRWVGIAEEDRHRFTATPWKGEFRFFRSPNVIPIEVARCLRDQLREANSGKPGPQAE